MTERRCLPLVYIDTNVFVDLLQGSVGLVDRLASFFETLRQSPGAATTSELTYAELMGKEAPGFDWDIQKEFYLGLLDINSFIALCPVTFDILAETGELRRSARSDGRQLKLPDAIHLATALGVKCRYFLTSDRRISAPSQLERIAPDEAGLKAIEALLNA